MYTAPNVPFTHAQLEEAMEELGLKNKDLATLLGIGKNSISRVKTGGTITQQLTNGVSMLLEIKHNQEAFKLLTEGLEPINKINPRDHGFTI